MRAGRGPAALVTAGGRGPGVWLVRVWTLPSAAAGPHATSGISGVGGAVLISLTGEPRPIQLQADEPEPRKSCPS